MYCCNIYFLSLHYHHRYAPNVFWNPLASLQIKISGVLKPSLCLCLRWWGSSYYMIWRRYIRSWLFRMRLRLQWANCWRKYWDWVKLFHTAIYLHQVSFWLNFHYNLSDLFSFDLFIFSLSWYTRQTGDTVVKQTDQMDWGNMKKHHNYFLRGS